MEHWYSDTGRVRQRTRGEACIIVTLSTTNPTNTAPVASPVTCSMNRASYRFSCDVVPRLQSVCRVKLAITVSLTFLSASFRYMPFEP